MRISTIVPTAIALFSTLVKGWQDDNSGATVEHTIYAYGINATFIGHGARLTSMYVHDKNNNPREIVTGYDDPKQYLIDSETNRTFFGAVVGPYANRIKNGTFTIGDQTYHVEENEHDGEDTLHGGFTGYDRRNWTVSQYNTSSITYTLWDDDGTYGFPGTRVTHVTYSVSDATETSRGTFTSRIVGISLDKATPLMMANHIYWNLGAYQSPTILNDTLWMPNADRIIDIDGIEVPTGGLQSVRDPWQSPAVPLNFTSPKQLYEGVLYSQQCGTGCTGIDNAYIIDRPRYSGDESMESPQLIWSSPDTGITMKVYTNQQSFQIYTCVGQNGTIRTHAAQGNAPIEKYGCMVIETQQWIDGINHPEWGQLDRQIYGPNTGPSVAWTKYDFSTDWPY